MDRGVKIAIFVASIAALSLGLVWDRVLSGARVIVEKAPSPDPFAPEEMRAVVRAASPRVDFPAKPEEQTAPPAETSPAVQTPVQDQPVGPQPDEGWTDYRAKRGDGWWTIAHSVFKGRGLTTNDIIKANPDIKGDPKEGQLIKIPPVKR